MALLRHVAAMLAEDGWRASNVDCAVVCERPKIAPYRDEMQRNLSSAVGAPVTVKGNRAEQLQTASDFTLQRLPIRATTKARY